MSSVVDLMPLLDYKEETFIVEPDYLRADRIRGQRTRRVYWARVRRLRRIELRANRCIQGMLEEQYLASFFGAGFAALTPEIKRDVFDRAVNSYYGLFGV